MNNNEYYEEIENPYDRMIYVALDQIEDKTNTLMVDKDDISVRCKLIKELINQENGSI